MTQLRKSTKIYPEGTMFGYMKIIGKPRHFKRSDGNKGLEEHCMCTICGKEKYVERGCLVRGVIKSCGGAGCKQKVTGERLKRSKTTHGMTRTRFYHIYHSAKSRCEYKKNNDYYLYGARGIRFMWKTFEEFKEDMYESYLDHVRIYGEKDTTIERIDNNKNYCKENCTRATNKEQSNHISKNIKVEYNGKIYNSISMMCDDLGVEYRLVAGRLRNGWTVQEAVETTDKKRRLHDKQCKPIIYKGKTYYSIGHFSRELGINGKYVSRMLIEGYDIDTIVEKQLNNIYKKIIE